LEVAKAFKPTIQGEEYLKFLTEIYVGAIDPKALDSLPVEKQFEVVKFFWKLFSQFVRILKQCTVQ